MDQKIMDQKIIACPSTDGIFVVWTADEMISDCVGFALFRDVEGKGASVVNTWVGFEDQTHAHKQGEHRPSTEWPIQKTSWTDYMAPTNGRVRYGVVPVVKDGPASVKPTQKQPETWSGYVCVAQDGPLSAWFNRGTISAQWLARAIGGAPKSSQTLFKSIDTKNNKIRDFLKGALGARLLALLGEVRTSKKREIYVALYELNDPELVAALSALKKRAHVVLGNSTGKSDATARETEKNASVLKKAGVDIVRRKIAPARYAHNKFVVFCGDGGKPERVWTGSTNWTRTGLCTQNNNGLEIADAVIAKAFRDHWQKLHDDGSKSPPALAKAGDHEWDFTLQESKLRVWFTPTTKSGDLSEATRLIDNAQQGVLCLMLNPGPDGLLGPVLEAANRKGHGTSRLYVRGVLNNFPAQGKDSPRDQLTLLSSDGEHQVFKGKQLAAVTKPAAIDAAADWWLRELKNTGKFMIAVHSKVIVIDPAGENPVVMTGSHNFSKRASKKNDDNLVIIQGDHDLARTYAANIIGIYNTYRWQAWRNTEEGQQDHGLKRNDGWLQNRIGKPWATTEARFWLGDGVETAARPSTHAVQRHYQQQQVDHHPAPAPMATHGSGGGYND
jgi:phosphatidylserine/phosphatidylglycerophosphate/cardiolipin synthase-like enzyme